MSEEIFCSKLFWQQVYAAFREAIDDELELGKPFHVAVDEACKTVDQRIQHHEGKANLYLGEDYFEKITDGEREAFAKGVLLGNYFGFSNRKVVQKADDEDLN